MSKLFGTDSTRGIAVSGIPCEIAMQAGRAAAAVFDPKKNKKTKIIVAKDKSKSSDILEAAVCAGICSAGADAEELGVIPAAAAAYLVKAHDADAGIMISSAFGSAKASGIRLFDADGQRPDAALEKHIERLSFGRPDAPELLTNSESGSILRCETAEEEYILRLKEIVTADLSGMKIAVDSSAGCTHGIAGRLFSELGAEVITVSDVSGSSDIDDALTPLDRLIGTVTDNECLCGFTFDGDGGGCLAVDETGRPAKGEELLAIFASDLNAKKKLKHDSVVAPVTSGMGLMSYLKERGIGFVTTGASDRYPAYRMKEGGYNLGGEPGGRILFSDDSPIEDGLLTALKLLEIMKEQDKSLGELAEGIECLPQIVLNVRIAVKKREIWKNDAEIIGMIERISDELGSEGRMIVCENSTAEPSVRITAEGPDFEKINRCAMEAARFIKKRCGGK